MSERLPKDDFFDSVGRLALTFSDVRLRTGFSTVLPRDVNLETFFTRRIKLKIPLVAAAMDTVTGPRMAIALAKRGGIAVLHAQEDVDMQSDDVARVKHHLHGVISKPKCAFVGQTLADVLDRLDSKDHKFRTLPVVERDSRVLRGMLTSRDFQIHDNDLTIPVAEAMTELKDLMTAPTGTTLEEAWDFFSRKSKFNTLPLVDEEGRCEGLYLRSEVKSVMKGERKGYATDAEGRLLVAAAIGVGESALLNAGILIRKGVDVIVIDTAHGDTQLVRDTLRSGKQMFPDIDFMVGNVSQGASAKRLLDAGADGIKVGQGPGSICTTRIVAGVGCPQVSAIERCERAIRGSGIPICADGGITYPGDIPIALGAGASTVMMGRRFAGTDEAPGEVVYPRGVAMKKYSGMGSPKSMKARAVARARYRQEQSGKMIAEGIDGIVPCQGPVDVILDQLIGGVLAGMGYVGAADIRTLHTIADFDQITGNGFTESKPHEVEAENDASKTI